ncbi:hypothetical protein NO995_09610 [Aestuariibaculum sp. M13]|uniref:hypothetical protein n=1 Tax=Aestuariibaculum sp. M13 TaxID=2967132 RepID=UPI002159DEE9|nr:hypothetical protein [Aestuariibaculum sp. M13]MCR8667937.1 hypothetical protein [Aestuariibaculum sp. M13]
MKKINDLYSEIELIINPEIEYYHELKNIKIHDKWINEIDYLFFNEWEEKLKTKINEITDLESPIKIKLAKVFHQELLTKYDDLLKLDYTNISYLKALPRNIFMNNFFMKRPISKCKDFYFSPDNSDAYEEILTKMSEVYGFEDFFENFPQDTYSPEELKDILQDEILFKLNEKEENLDMLYSYAYLSLFLENQRKMFGRITKYLDNLINFIKKLETFKEDDITLDEVLVNNPNNLKLEFKISKKEIAILFKNLSDCEIFHVDNTGFKHEHTQLKKYIDNANMYFSHNGELKPVKGINKEFAKIYGTEERIMHRDFEKKFLKGLIKDLTKRIEEINSEEL